MSEGRVRELLACLCPSRTLSTRRQEMGECAREDTRTRSRPRCAPSRVGAHSMPLRRRRSAAPPPSFRPATRAFAPECSPPSPPPRRCAASARSKAPAVAAGRRSLAPFVEMERDLPIKP